MFGEDTFVWPEASVSLVRSDAAETRMEPRTHEFGFILDPATDHEAWVDQGPAKRFAMSPGMGWVVPAGALAYAAWRHPLRFLEVSIEPATFEAFHLRQDLGSVSLRAAQEFHDPLLVDIVNALYRAAGGETDVSAMCRDALLDALMLHLGQGWSANRALRPLRSARPEVQRAMAYVDDNLAGPLTLDEMAGVACLSRFHFARVFKIETGLSPHSFVIARRIARAEQLLIRTRLSLAEVARRSGFSNVARLSDAMRRQTGRTAGDVRAILDP